VSTPICRIHSQHSRSLVRTQSFHQKTWHYLITPLDRSAHTNKTIPTPNTAQNGLRRQVQLLPGQSPNKHCNPRVYYVISFSGRSRWSRGLRRRSTAGRWLELPFRIAPGARMSVSRESSVMSRRGLCDWPIPRTEKNYRVFVSRRNSILHLP
jgi:hypothetical protein